MVTFSDALRPLRPLPYNTTMDARIILKQLLAGVLTLWVVVTATFFLLRLLPGGPFDAEKRLPPAIQQQIEAKYHLNEPVWQQYGRYMGGLLHGDLGPSYKYLSRSVNDMVAQAAGPSFVIGGGALLLGCLVGLVVAIVPRWWHTSDFSAGHAGLERSTHLLGVLALSTPSFIVAGVLVLVGALWLHWFPAARLSSAHHAVLPIVSLALVPFAYTVLWVRNAMATVAKQPYIHTKAAFGLAHGQLVLAHIARNALLPWVALLGPLAAALLTGSFAVEFIFAIPGLGKYFITAVTDRDYPLVMGITLLYSTLLITLNTVTDIALRWLDPRLRGAAGEVA